jgi:hypothetical protein
MPDTNARSYELRVAEVNGETKPLVGYAKVGENTLDVP